MEEQLIEFETAKLAKEKGFDVRTQKSYNLDGIFAIDWVAETGNIYFAPTQSLLQKWLREVHNIIVFINPGIDLFGFVVIYNNGKNRTSGNDFKTWEEALELGLQQGLKLIK